MTLQEPLIAKILFTSNCEWLPKTTWGLCSAWLRKAGWDIAILAISLYFPLIPPGLAPLDIPICWANGWM